LVQDSGWAWSPASAVARCRYSQQDSRLLANSLNLSAADRFRQFSSVSSCVASRSFPNCYSIPRMNMMLRFLDGLPNGAKRLPTIDQKRDAIARDQRVADCTRKA
jgi:hypothetical protein